MTKHKRIQPDTTLCQIPNVGPATELDLQLLGIEAPADLVGQDAFDLWHRLGEPPDPCVIDVFMAVIDFAEGGKPRPWWTYTARRKAILAAREQAASL